MASVDNFFKKGIYTWKIPFIHNGDPEEVVRMLVELGMETVYLKVADGPYLFQCADTKGKVRINVTQDLINALRKANISPIGWQFNYGYDPIGEAKIASHLIDVYDLDGMIFDVEDRGYGFVKGSSSLAVTRMNLLLGTFRELQPDFPCMFCGWPFYMSTRDSRIQWHPKDVAITAAKYVDAMQPMAYWEGATASAATSYLDKSYKQWKTFSNKPFIPAGRAWTGDGGTVTPNAVRAFYNYSYEKCGAKGISWWFLDFLVRPEYAGVASAIAEVNGSVVVPQPPPPVIVSGNIYTCETTELNIRIGPSLDNGVKRRMLQKGDEVKITGDAVEKDSVIWLPVEMWTAYHDKRTGGDYGTIRSE